MIHAIMIVLVSALLQKFGVRELRPDEEAELPSYFVKAERIQRNVGGIVFGIIFVIGITVAIAEKFGW